ncbi:cytochrome c oxidase subunit 4 isoform 1, mitochondrial isoform X2 [Nomia melanderi]|nr:cytochrome c oxidase subunit 4 isoform 1, mitochondrial-like isoform X2 [Nomia melanderi]
MMASKLFISCLRQNIPSHSRRMSAHSVMFPDRIGNRDVVGHGYNGDETYVDRVDCPMPAIRFKRNTPDVMALREKEKGDWKRLSIEEKKALYRASFRQTFAEIQAPTGELKGALGLSLVGVALSIWLFYFFKVFAYPPLPESFDEEHRLAQMERMKLLQVNPISGISAK